MTENLLRVLIALGILLIAAATAAAQSWNDTQGSSIVRVGHMATYDPYARPGLFFLKRPERVMPPAFAQVYPHTLVLRFENRDGTLVSEYRSSSDRGDAYAEIRSTVATLRRAKGRAAQR